MQKYFGFYLGAFLLAFLTDGVRMGIRFLNLADQFPDRRKGFLKLLIGGSLLPFFAVLFYLVAILSQPEGPYGILHPEEPKFFVYFFQAYLIGMHLVLFIWIMAGGGAQFLVNHGELLLRKPSSPNSVKFSFIAFTLGLLVVLSITY